MIDDINYSDPTSRTGPDGYINYKMSGGDKLGSDSEPGCGGFGWFFIILFVLWLIRKVAGN